MGLPTIGAFAKASRLSPKALRLYDQLGLLTPARVDPVTGYRLYAPDQLDQARLVAWLRRLGMPLARIQHVCTLDAGPAGQEVRAFWAQVEADTAARRDLATFLIAHLSRKDPVMSPTAKSLGIRYAALSDKGLVRESNQDTAYAGSRLLAVADGCGSQGAPASAAAIDAFKHLETDSIPVATSSTSSKTSSNRPSRPCTTSPGRALHPKAPARHSPRCSGPDHSWPSSTSATPGSTYCAAESCSRSPTTTPWSSRWSTKDASARKKPPPTPNGRSWCGPWAQEPTPIPTCASTTPRGKTDICCAPTACRLSCRPKRSTEYSPRSVSPSRPSANSSPSPTPPAAPITSAA